MRFLLALAFVAMAASGCTKTVKHDVAVFNLAPGRISQPAPASGNYAVKVASLGEGVFERVPVPRIRVQRGTVMGFETTPEGVVAFAGEERIAIDIPDGATLKWQAKTKRQTQFVKNMRRTGQVALWGAAGVGAMVADGTIDEAIDNGLDRATNTKKRDRREERYEPRDHETDFRLFRDIYWATLKEATEK